MNLTPADFMKLATGNCLYVTGIPRPFIIVSAGVANGNLWISCPGEDFHVLMTGGLTLTREADNLTWRDPDGQACMVITPLSACEELSAGDVMEKIANAREFYATTGKEWLEQQITGAAEATPEALSWQTNNATPPPGK